MSEETMVDEKVTYTINTNGQLIVIENVPARVCVETGEQFFSPETVERLQKKIWGTEPPKRFVQIPVYEFN